MGERQEKTEIDEYHGGSLLVRVIGVQEPRFFDGAPSRNRVTQGRHPITHSLSIHRRSAGGGGLIKKTPVFDERALFVNRDELQAFAGDLHKLHDDAGMQAELLAHVFGNDDAAGFIHTDFVDLDRIHGHNVLSSENGLAGVAERFFRSLNVAIFVRSTMP